MASARTHLGLLALSALIAGCPAGPSAPAVRGPATAPRPSTRATSATGVAVGSDPNAARVDDAAPCTLGTARAVSGNERGALQGNLTIAAHGPDVTVAYTRHPPPSPEPVGDTYDGDEPRVATWTGTSYGHLTRTDVGISSAASSSQATTAIALASPRGDASPISVLTFAQTGMRTFGLARALSDLSGYPRATASIEPPSFAASMPGGGFVAASRADGKVRAIALADGIHTPWPTFAECYQRLEEGKGRPPCFSAGPPTESMFIVFPLSGTPRATRLAAFGAAAIAIGDTRGAYVLRKPQELAIGTFSADGSRVDLPVTVRKGDVGAPTAAFAGDTLWVAWAERASPSAPHRLYVLAWPAGVSIPPSPTPLDTGAGDDAAFAPSLAVSKGRVVLAWTEGDLSKRGTVHACSWPADHAPPSSVRAPALSADVDNARDPELAAGDATWMAWTRYSKSKPDGDVMAAPLACP